MTVQEEPALADEIERDVIAAAVRRNPGANPQSHTLTERERIIIGAIERRRVVMLTRFTEGEVKRLQRIIHSDDGA